MAPLLLKPTCRRRKPKRAMRLRKKVNLLAGSNSVMIRKKRRKPRKPRPLMRERRHSITRRFSIAHTTLTSRRGLTSITSWRQTIVLWADPAKGPTFARTPRWSSIETATTSNHWRASEGETVPRSLQAACLVRPMATDLRCSLLTCIETSTTRPSALMVSAAQTRRRWRLSRISFPKKTGPVEPQTSTGDRLSTKAVSTT